MYTFATQRAQPRLTSSLPPSHVSPLHRADSLDIDQAPSTTDAPETKGKCRGLFHGCFEYTDRCTVLTITEHRFRSHASRLYIVVSRLSIVQTDVPLLFLHARFCHTLKVSFYIIGAVVAVSPAFGIIYM